MKSQVEFQVLRNGKQESVVLTIEHPNFSYIPSKIVNGISYDEIKVSDQLYEYLDTIDKLKGFDGTYFNIYHDDPLDWDWGVSEVSVEDIKPYLFPLSSMTEEQMEELEELCDMYTPDDDYRPYAYLGIKVLYKHVLDDGYKFGFKSYVIDWFNKNHFDYRGLIEKGLAIDCTTLNIY